MMKIGNSRMMAGRLFCILLFAILASSSIAENANDFEVDTPTYKAGEFSEKGLESDANKKHPPGILNESDISSIKKVARRISTDKHIRSDAALKAFSHLSLRLDEVYDDAPQAFSVDGKLYEIKLEKLTNTIGSRSSTNETVVFLAHDLYSGLGEQVVLGFIDGKEFHLTEADMAGDLVFAITANEVDDQLARTERSNVTAMTGEIRLGDPKIRIDRPGVENASEIAELIGGRLMRATACTHQSPIQFCSGGVPYCSGNQKPYFVAQRLLIKDDREGFLKGNPEIELFTFNSDGVGQLPEEGSTTTLIFDGRSVADAAGRERFLPDVNNTNMYYTIADGAALLPYDLGASWIMSLVEQDDTTGVLKNDEPVRNVRKYDETPDVPTIEVTDMNFLNILKFFAEVVASFIFGGDGDDIYAEPIGVDQALACGTGLGGTQFTLNSQQWNIRGHYACIDPSCAPLSATISGATDIPLYISATWSANIETGTSPYTYQWKKDGSVVGSGSSYTTSSTEPFLLTLRVTDATGQSDTHSEWITISDPSTCGDLIC